MEFLETVTLKQVFDFIAGGIAVISVIMEFSKKIPFNPWSFIFSRIGKALNSDLEKKLDELEKGQTTNKEAIKELGAEIVNLKGNMEIRFDESAKEADTKEAKRLRSNIISFADSCRVHHKHTKNAFENIIRDYDDYMDYCTKHKIKNHFIDDEIRYIESVYMECQKENKFI